MKFSRLLRNKQILGFSFYDFANSAFILLINSYLFPIFLKTEVFGNEQIGDYYWGFAVSISVLIAVIASPIIGNFADKGARKNTLSFLIILTLIGTIGLSFIPSTSQLALVIAYIFTNACYTASLAIYDSLLPHITSSEESTQVSTFSWGIGYLGGIICFLLIFAAQTIFGISHQIAFLLTGVFYGVFSLISLRNMPATVIDTQTKQLNFPKIKTMFPWHIIVLLLAMWLINDALDTVLNFTSLFGVGTLGLSTTAVGMILLAVQLLAVPSTILLGKLAKKVGEKPVILASIAVWLLICLLGIFATSLTFLILIVVLTSLVIGTTSALLRSYYSNRIDKQHSSLSFSLYSIATRSSSLVGPLVFGLISAVTGSQRLAIISIMAPLFLGAMLFIYATNPARQKN